MSDDARSGRLHLWSGLIILGVYLAGAATAAGVFAWMRPHVYGRGHDGGGPFGFLRGLDLTPEQEQKAYAIIDSHHAEVEAAMKETFPRIRATADKALDEIRAILTPDQLERFDAGRAELEAHPPRFPPFGPGHHGAP